MPPGPPVSLQELQGGAGTWCDVGTQVPGLMTPSSCREGLGSGRWPEGREGATGLGGAAADSLFSGTLSQAYTTSSAAPQPRHGSPSGWQGAPANSPSLAAPTARHGREQAGSRGLSWLGSAHPDAGAFSISLGVHSQAGWQPGAPARSSPQPREPQGHLCPGAPGQDGGSRALRHSACMQTLPVFMEQQDRAERGQVLPQPGQQHGH